jgi:citrate lyase beta subunit
MSALLTAQTVLFVPGSTPRRFATALDSGTDLVIIDLEDAVAPGDRAAARKAILAFALGGAGAVADGASPVADGQSSPEDGARRFLVRINPAASADREPDLALLAQLRNRAPSALAGVVLPKAESAADLETVSRAVGGTPVLALVETVTGLHAADELLAAEVEMRLGFGALDFAVDAGGEAPALLDAARIRLVLASRLAGAAPPLESPSPEVHDLEAVAAAARHASSLGMGGMLAIHPGQLPVITRAFAPTEEEIAWAHTVAAAGDGASQVDGRMVDAPVLARARRILTRSQETA